MNKNTISNLFYNYKNYYFWTSFTNKLNYQIAINKETLKQEYLKRDNQKLKKRYYYLEPNYITYQKVKKILNIKKITNQDNLNIIKLGLKLTSNPLKIIKSYLQVKYDQYQYHKELEISQEKLLQNNNSKILIAFDTDKYFIEDIEYYLTNNLKIKDRTLIYSDRLNKKQKKLYSIGFLRPIYKEINKEVIGSMNYYQYVVDKIILITQKEKITKEYLSKNINTPIKYIFINQKTSFKKTIKLLRNIITSKE